MGKPIEVVSDRALRATVWRVEAKTVFYTVSLTKIYRDRNGEWKESPSFADYELERVGKLLHCVEGRVADLKAREKGMATLSGMHRAG